MAIVLGRERVNVEFDRSKFVSLCVLRNKNPMTLEDCISFVFKRIGVE